jgi:hypothetical protein
VLSVEGTTVKLTSERISTCVNAYAADVSSDGRWAVIGNSGVGGRIVAILDGRLVDTGTRIPLAAGPMSIRSMPR